MNRRSYRERLKKLNENKPQEWGAIVTYLTKEKSNINVKICASCGHARIYEGEAVTMVTRFDSLDKVKKIVDSIKQKNASIN